MTSGDFLNLLAFQTTDQSFAYGRSLGCNPASVPNVHLDKTGRLNSLHIDCIAMIQHCEVRAEPSALDNMAQVRDRDFAQSIALHRLAAQTQHSNAQSVLTRLSVA